MKTIFWVLSVVLVLVMATAASADTRNDLGISSAIDSYSGCLTSVNLLDKDVNLPYSEVLAKTTPKRKFRAGEPRLRASSWKNRPTTAPVPPRPVFPLPVPKRTGR